MSALHPNTLSLKDILSDAMFLSEKKEVIFFFPLEMYVLGESLFQILKMYQESVEIWQWGNEGLWAEK